MIVFFSNGGGGKEIWRVCGAECLYACFKWDFNVEINVYMYVCTLNVVIAVKFKQIDFYFSFDISEKANAFVFCICDFKCFISFG